MSLLPGITFRPFLVRTALQSSSMSPTFCRRDSLQRMVPAHSIPVCATVSRVRWGASPKVQLGSAGSRTQLSDKPGFGIELNEDHVQANRVAGEQWWS